MSTRPYLASLIIAALALPAAAAAQVDPGDDGAQAATPYDVTAVGDDVLANAYGTGARLPFQRDMQALSDANTLPQLQQEGQTARVALDNWWSQTGAALIANNLLAGR